MSNRLSPRQDECLRLTRALTDREIAARLGISEPTVKKHVREACQKMGVNRRKAALAILEAGDAATAPPPEPEAAPLPSVPEPISRRRLGYAPPPRGVIARIMISLILATLVSLTVTALTVAVADHHRHVDRIDRATTGPVATP